MRKFLGRSGRVGKRLLTLYKSLSGSAKKWTAIVGTAAVVIGAAAIRYIDVAKVQWGVVWGWVNAGHTHQLLTFLFLVCLLALSALYQTEKEADEFSQFLSEHSDKTADLRPILNFNFGRQEHDVLIFSVGVVLNSSRVDKDLRILIDKVELLGKPHWKPLDVKILERSIQFGLKGLNKGLVPWGSRIDLPARDKGVIRISCYCCRVPPSSVVVFSRSVVAAESRKGSVPDSAGGGGIRD